MKTIQKTGGIAALFACFSFIFGFALFFTALKPLGGESSWQDILAVLMEREGLVYLWNLVIYVFFGIALVPLSLVLAKQTEEKLPLLSSVASVFGFLWAGLVIASGMVANVGISAVLVMAVENTEAAESLWTAVDTVSIGLGGGNEIVGGIWVMLVSLAGGLTKRLPHLLVFLGSVSGAAGIVTLIPALSFLGALFGLGLIIWFFGVGLYLICDRTTK